MDVKRTARGFQDLYVYKNLYAAMEEVLREIVPKLPPEERFDLADQLRRACKAPLAIIAEGYAKRHQKRNWFKYLEDAIGECNEMMTHLNICKDVYGRHVEKALCEKLIKAYDVSGKQLYALGKNWRVK